MPVKSVPTMGWTRNSAALTILAVTAAQQREMGARVAELRDGKGWTNERLAREAGLSVKTVSRFVHGKHEPRGNTIAAFAKVFDVTEEYIRGNPPVPLGLGATAPDNQLAAINAKLDLILAHLELAAKEPVKPPDLAGQAARETRARRVSRRKGSAGPQTAP